jgi:transcriptional antiterminator Rof (Rho-off)
VKVHELLAEFKKMTLDMTDELYTIRKEKDDISKRSKGGQTVYSLDKHVKVEIKSGSRTIYDTEIAEAGEAAFDRFIKKKSDNGADTDVIQILRAALTKRDGDYDPRKLANLYKLKIEDEDFQDGLRLFNEARDTNRTKSYIKVERKTGREGEYETVLLDVARL